MEKRLNMKVAVPEVVAEHYKLNEETLLEAYYEDGFIYVEGVEMDDCEVIVDEVIETDCPHRCPCCGHCNFED